MFFNSMSIAISVVEVHGFEQKLFIKSKAKALEMTCHSIFSTVQ